MSFASHVQKPGLGEVVLLSLTYCDCDRPFEPRLATAGECPLSEYASIHERDGRVVVTVSCPIRCVSEKDGVNDCHPAGKVRPDVVRLVDRYTSS